jgi:uncharacterized membrane protein YjdF
MGNTKYDKTKKIIFFTNIIIILLFLIVFSIYQRDYIKDCIFGLLALVILYFIEKKYPLKPTYLILAITPLMLNLIGLAFNFYAFAIYGVGYDKMIHFLNCAVITLVIYSWLEKYPKDIALKLFVIILIVLGLGAVGELMEFVGQQYIHIYGPTMFSQGDLLSSTITNDLIVYDTWWDIIFDFFGATLMALLIFFKTIKIRNE